jgi:hypothetical protein
VLALDVNVLVDAFREDSPHHGRIARWMQAMLASEEPFVVFDAVASGFVRVVTHPRIFDPPTPIGPALEFVGALHQQPLCVRLAPGARHWAIFDRLCRESGATGNLAADAYLAAMAIEAGCTWVTSDRDYARFAGLRWIEPDRGLPRRR